MAQPPLAGALSGPLASLLGRARPWSPGTDIWLAIGVIALVAVLILPLPTLILDLGLALSVTASVLVLMVAVFLRRPLDFAGFPRCCC